jgi:hypothetical protein
MSNLESAVRQIAALRVGEAFSKAKFIPAGTVNLHRIKQYRRDLMSTLSSAISRAKMNSNANYEIHTVHSFTTHYDVVVAAVVVRVAQSRPPDNDTEL